jgi:hypothetical protein
MINFKFGIGTFLGDNMNAIVMGLFLGRCILQEMRYCVKTCKIGRFTFCNVSSVNTRIGTSICHRAICTWNGLDRSC